MTVETGGCAYGAARHESDAAPTVNAELPLHDCRKAGGSGYAAIVIVEKSSLQLSGEARFHKLRGGSGSIIECGFCPGCGKPPLREVRAVSKRARCPSGQLGRALHKPSMALYTDNALALDMMDPRQSSLQGVRHSLSSENDYSTYPTDDTRSILASIGSRGCFAV
jgi:hypothetical protein